MYAKQFREAIERCDTRKLPITFEQFPLGACGDATLLVAKYLQEVGEEGFRYVCGERSKGKNGGFQSHAWLEQGSTIIDITADQFSDIHSPVVVTTNHTWYDQFDKKIDHPANISEYDVHTVSVLEAAYDEIKKHLNID